jgi:hypothetical protein
LARVDEARIVLSSTFDDGGSMPTNRMSRFEIFIGTWNTTGEVLAVDGAEATVLSATDTYRWLPGRQFIVHDVDARFGRTVSRSMEVMGYDQEAKKYFARSYDDQGVSEVFDVNLRGKKWSISGATVRFNGGFDTQGDRLTGLWEMKGKKGGWQPWIKLQLVRA